MVKPVVLILALMFTVASVLTLSSPILAQTQSETQSAEGHARCLLLGPLVISGYLELFSQVSQKKRDKVGIRAGQVSSLIELYDRLGCGRAELIAAVECLSLVMLDKKNTSPIGQKAESCMRQSGMPVQ